MINNRGTRNHLNIGLEEDFFINLDLSSSHDLIRSSGIFTKGTAEKYYFPSG